MQEQILGAQWLGGHSDLVVCSAEKQITIFKTSIL